MVAQKNQRVLIVRDDMIRMNQSAAEIQTAEENQESGKIRLPVRFADHAGNLFLQSRIRCPFLLQSHQLPDLADIPPAQRKPESTDQCADQDKEDRNGHDRLEP